MYLLQAPINKGYGRGTCAVGEVAMGGAGVTLAVVVRADLRVAAHGACSCSRCSGVCEQSYALQHFGCATGGVAAEDAVGGRASGWVVQPSQMQFCRMQPWVVQPWMMPRRWPHETYMMTA